VCERVCERERECVRERERVDQLCDTLALALARAWLMTFP
jgi:hypothetical protein